MPQSANAFYARILRTALEDIRNGTGDPLEAIEDIADKLDKEPGEGPVIANGIGVVGMWTLTTSPAVSNWVSRHWDIIPEPDVVLLSPSGAEVYGWTEAKRPQWDAFAKARQKPTERHVKHYS